MSYLDVPRLCFAGTFTANPSTINNTITNYDPNTINSLDLSWNPYGSHAWTVNATVESFVDANSQLHTGGDPLIGAALQSYEPQVPAKLVDLDTDQQGVTRLFGLNLQITLPGNEVALQGLWEDGGTLINLWPRVPSLVSPQGIPDSAFGGAFQSVLQQIVWKNLAGSPFLQQLQEAAALGLSVRLSVTGYQDSNASPAFRIGSIAGTIGPQYEGEPLHLPPRLLMPASGQSPLYYAPAKVNGAGTTVTIDLGNSLPDQDPGGPPADLGTVQAAVLEGSTPTVLGTVDYQGPAFAQTAGVVQFPLGEQQAGLPLAILVNGATQLAENADGLYIDVDGSSLYLNPGDKATAPLVATSFGSGAPNQTVPLSIMVQTNAKGKPINNSPPPPKGVAFPPSVTTDAAGQAQIPLTASNPVPVEPRRQFVGGQVYFIGGPWAAGNVAGAPLNVKVFNSIEPPIANPTWSDVQPVLFQFYFLYAYMAGIVDLSNYDDVVANAQGIQQVLTKPFSDPNYMPVTREMSADQRKLVLDWIAQGCPQ